MKPLDKEHYHYEFGHTGPTETCEHCDKEVPEDEYLFVEPLNDYYCVACLDNLHFDLGMILREWGA